MMKQNKDIDAAFVDNSLKLKLNKHQCVKRTEVTIIADSDILVPIETVLEAIPIEELVDYILESNKLPSLMNGDKIAIFKLLDGLDYDHVKEWLLEKGRYRLYP